MSLAIIYTRASLGVDAPEVTVEVHISSGLPALNIVGLPEVTVKESRDRVRCALINAGFEFPVRRITVNLAPADLPKEGGRFDLPIALGILVASGQLPTDAVKNTEFLGELSLTGKLRSVRGLLSAIIATKKVKRALVIPAQQENTEIYNGAVVYLATSLLMVTSHLLGQNPLSPEVSRPLPKSEVKGRDLSEVIGQFKARRALEITAAGGHGLLMFGPPGTGKTLLAECLANIQPELTEDERFQVGAVYSLLSAGSSNNLMYNRPFRAPHHTASAVAMVGGGSIPKPGEVSLAHNGVLFLDELPEFDRKVLEVLRQPMEGGEVTISRAALQITFPARFQLIAAMNPCPCGYSGDKIKPCHCTSMQIQRYKNKISGPLLDRIDMHVEVSRIPANEIIDKKYQPESSVEVRKRVTKAVNIQIMRQKKLNARLTHAELNKFAILTKESTALLKVMIDKLSLSMRIVHRLTKVARTIADLEKSPHIGVKHLSEALSFRELTEKK